jgi:predicted nucleic acid-binding protein
VDSQRVLELVRDSDCSAYDCEFVALALRLDTKLVTMDAKLLTAFSGRTVSLTAQG